MSREGRKAGATARGPHLCSMKITQEVRDYAASRALAYDEAIQKGMEEKSIEFVKHGVEIYRKA